MHSRTRASGNAAPSNAQANAQSNAQAADYYVMSLAQYDQNFNVHTFGLHAPERIGLAVFIRTPQASANRALKLLSYTSGASPSPHGSGWRTLLTYGYEPVYWSRIDADLYGAHLARAYPASLQTYQPVGHFRSADCEHFAALPPERQGEAYCAAYIKRLLAQSNHPLQAGVWLMEYHPERRMDQLNALDRAYYAALFDGSTFGAADWENRHTAIKTIDRNSGRYKFWRKQAAQGKLPPVLALLARSIHSHILLDGHLRFAAALEQGLLPACIRLSHANSTANQAIPLEENREFQGVLREYENRRAAGTLTPDVSATLNARLATAADTRPLLYQDTLATLDADAGRWLRTLLQHAQAHNWTADMRAAFGM